MPVQPSIDRAFIREAEDGTTVFFPWGLSHRGYQLPDQASKKRASRAPAALVGSTIAIGTWTAYVLQPLVESQGNGSGEILSALAAPGVALLLVICSYWVWASRFVQELPESSLKFSREERLREAADFAGPGRIALIGVIVSGLSALLIWLEPHAWWLGFLGVVLGLGLLRWSLLLKNARRIC